MPCTERRARLLLQRGRAVIHRFRPFTIRLKDRWLEESVLQPIVLKMDPGSQTTGMGIGREEETPAGQVHYLLHFCEVQHKGGLVAERMRKRAAYRRRRRVTWMRMGSPGAIGCARRGCMDFRRGIWSGPRCRRGSRPGSIMGG